MNFVRGLIANTRTGIIGLRHQNSQAQKLFKVLSFAEARKEIQEENTLLLDVREKGELSTDGRISEKGKNIPVGEIPKALVLDDEAFKEQYGFEKPKSSQNIVIHCKAGVRAELAAKVMGQLGYKNLKIYPGINDWLENGGQLKK